MIEHGEVTDGPIYNEREDVYEIKCLCGWEYDSWGYLAAEGLLAEHLNREVGEWA